MATWSPFLRKVPEQTEFVLDSHTHVVSPDRERYPLADPDPPPGAWQLEAPVSVEGLLAEMDGGGVAGAVLVQAMGCYGTDNRYILDSALAHPERLVAVGAVDALHDDRASEALRGFVGNGGRGVRLGLANDDADAVADPRVRSVVDTAGELDVPVVLAVRPHQLAGVAVLAQAAPEVRLLLDHCGFVSPSDATALFELAAHGNVAVKLSSMNLVDASDGAAEFTQRLVEAFGADRILWGSDYPHTHHTPYAGLVALAQEATAALSAEDALLMLGANTARLWGLAE